MIESIHNKPSQENVKVLLVDTSDENYKNAVRILLSYANMFFTPVKSNSTRMSKSIGLVAEHDGISAFMRASIEQPHARSSYDGIQLKQLQFGSGYDGVISQITINSQYAKIDYADPFTKHVMDSNTQVFWNSIRSPSEEGRPQSASIPMDQITVISTN